MLVTRNLLKDQVVADSGTYVLDIRDKANLHAIYLEVTATNGATAGLVIYNMITGIRLIKNGSEDVCVMTGNTCRQVAHDIGVNSMYDIYSLSASTVQTAVMPILFGHEVIDPNHYIRTDQLDSLQLRIDYAMTIAATGFATGTTKFSVVAIYNYDAPLGEYKGYFRTRTVYTFTSAASGATEVPLPVGQTLGSAHIGVNEYGTALATYISNILYQANQGDRVFYNDATARIQRMACVLDPERPQMAAGSLGVFVTEGACFKHDAFSFDTNVIPANTYKYLNLTLTNASAGKVIVTTVRDLVT